MITREQEWETPPGGMTQRWFPYGGYIIGDEDSPDIVKAALIEQGELSSFQCGGVWGIGKSDDSTYEGEFVRYLTTRDWFEGRTIEFAIQKALEWKELGNQDCD